MTQPEPSQIYRSYVSVPNLTVTSPVELVGDDAKMLDSVSVSTLNTDSVRVAITPKATVGNANIYQEAVSPARTKTSAA